MRVTTMRRGLVALAAVAVLTGCTVDANGDLEPRPLRDVTNIACDEARDIRIMLTNALDAPENSGQRREVEDWALDSRDEEQLQDMIDELDERIEVCDNEADGTTAEPSESPSASPSEDSTSSPGTTDDGSDEQDSYTDIVSWDQLVADPPNGLRGMVDTHSDDAGIRWSDIDRWAKARMPDGMGVDARIAVVFGRPGLTDTEVRGQSNLDGDVPVVRATRCYTVVSTDNQFCPEGDDRVALVLSPLVMNGNQVLHLRTQAGILLGGDLPLINYDLR